jgi:hypothetical protein
MPVTDDLINVQAYKLRDFMLIIGFKTKPWHIGTKGQKNSHPYSL